MSLNWSEALRAAGREGAVGVVLLHSRGRQGATSQEDALIRLGLSEVGGILALLLASLVASGKLLSQIEFQFYYLLKKKKVRTILLIPGDCCIS